MTRVYIDAVGLFAPGLEGWKNGREVLAGKTPYEAAELPKYKPQLLPANERRRATLATRIAFGACEDAIEGRLDDAAELAAVFASSGGDYTVNDQICRALLRPEKAVSPTLFHNSVHNAPAGYWSIASKSQRASVSLSAYDDSVAAGLIEAVTLAVAEQQPVLLVTSDSAVGEPMNQQRKVLQSFGAALWLSPEQSPNSIASLGLSLAAEACEQSRCQVSDLQALYDDNPSARILPLLELLARQTSGTLTLNQPSGLTLSLAVNASL